jgi:NAD(P)-dependent dehydrogenase (short-subunit alcohol dehydrogenase family)
VTGGASGLGAATVRRLAKAGARVVIVDVQDDLGFALQDELNGAARYYRADVRDEAAVAAAVEEAQTVSPLRVGVMCAGVGTGRRGRMIPREGVPAPVADFRRIIEINLVGTFIALRAAAIAMACNAPTCDGERGVIVTTASAAAFEGQTGQVAYASSKAGVSGMTLPAARDLDALGIRVVCIAPGTFDTPLIGLASDKLRQQLNRDIVFPKRLGHPDEYASLVEHVVMNPYLNAETIRLDAGIRLSRR